MRRSFPLADVFVEAGPRLHEQIERLIQLVFGKPTVSPSREEYAMFMAQAVALRSSDMSRQIGAVVVDDGEVIAAGCNEVPKPGGGVFWEGDSDDRRDFRLGEDPNARLGREVVREVLGALKQAGWLAPEQSADDPAALVDLARRNGVFEGARITNLIEFGRVVHAEMNALVFAAQRGVSVGGRWLYCTTFPCHVCARHIIGAGIAGVVYIEPYPKSLAVDLYSKEISLGKARGDAVEFRAFKGVAPRRYMDFFSFGKRKGALGYAKAWEPAPRARALGNPHLLSEQLVYSTVERWLTNQEEADGEDPQPTTA